MKFKYRHPSFCCQKCGENIGWLGRFLFPFFHECRYTPEELKKWWPAVCPVCGWEGLSRDCAGGNSIADTGDYDDPICPRCFKMERMIAVEDDKNFFEKRKQKD